MQQIEGIQTHFHIHSKVKYDGLSGKIEFDNTGVRSNITVDILELTEYGLEMVGTWMFGHENPVNRLKISRQIIAPLKIQTDDNSLKNKTLTIITALVIGRKILKF